MATHRIAVIPGDASGPEVMAEGIKVLNALSGATELKLEFDQFPWGSRMFMDTGDVMPPDGLSTLAPYDAIYLGAMGDPARVPDSVMFQKGLVQRIRKGFQQYVNLRPCRVLPGIPSPLKDPAGIDLVIVRENTEGDYSKIGGRLHVGTPGETAIQTAVFTRLGTERCIRYAFDLARQRNGKRKVTSVTKSNALNYSMVFWDEVFEAVSRDYPEVATERVYVDAMAMFLVTRPASFDVVVASNLFGDILSDEAAGLQGGLGLAPGANLNPERQFPSMFEPIHGSAPDLAGKGVANPIATIWAGLMMLDFLGEEAAASLLMRAIETILREGQVKTRDMGGRASTVEMGDAVAEKVVQLSRSSA